MPERHFSTRPQVLTGMPWTGDNLEEIRDFWEPKGFNRYVFDVDADGNLINPSGAPLPPGVITFPAGGGFGWTNETDLLAGMQEVANPEGLKYSIVEQPLP